MNQENHSLIQAEETEAGESEKRGKLKRSVLEWTETIVMAIALVATIFTFVVRIITVDGRSMEPTYHHGDRVLVTGYAGDIDQGDIVIIVHALSEPIIKRVVAVEGQTVDFDENTRELMVDGVPLKGEVFGLENGITVAPVMSDEAMKFPQIVPENSVFVLGDNRTNSKDSRYVDVGMVDHRNILGKVFFNIYPFSNIGSVS